MRSHKSVTSEGLAEENPLAKPEALSVENKQHYVLDVTFDEDRSQIRRLNGPMVMTCLRRYAISLLRVKGQTNIAQAFRWLWAKPHVAIRMALP